MTLGVLNFAFGSQKDLGRIAWKNFKKSDGPKMWTPVPRNAWAPLQLMLIEGLESYGSLAGRCLISNPLDQRKDMDISDEQLGPTHIGPTW